MGRRTHGGARRRTPPFRMGAGELIGEVRRFDEAERRLLFPDRRRCLACRRYLAVLVLRRLYCSYECAGMTPPSPEVGTWPRDCRTRANEPKVRYLYPGEVDAEPGVMNVYECDHCGMFHIGHRRER